MKDILKTIVLTGILVIICLIVFVVLGKVRYSVEMLSRTELDLTDPTVTILKDRITSNDYLRKAKMIPSELSDEELIEFTLNNLNNSDYTTMQVEPVKINCQVTDKIFFTSGSTCNLKVIDNSKFNEYIKKYFNIERELSYPVIQYRGYTCKNDGSKYYCLIKDYKKDFVSYSVLKDAYETKDKVVIREYYLKIDLTNNQRCLSYFSQASCVAGNAAILPYHIDDEIIKRDGVLYQHVFARNDNSFYLVESSIANER